MIVSIDWLKDFVDIKETPEELSEILSSVGLEAEYTDSFSEISNVIIGKVLSVEKHPNADRLNVCSVNDGENNYQVVCGAPNVQAGQIIAYAKVGSVLPGGFKLEKIKLRGVESSGMICSAKELNISDEHDGILVLPETCNIGGEFFKEYGYRYLNIELDITPNRPDAFSHYGVARDISVILGRELVSHSFTSKVKEFKPSFSLTIDDQNDCSRYVGGLLSNVSIKPSPQWMQERLIAVGQRPINNLVDISNYVLMEMGQPTHIFDWEKVQSNEILVRRAKKKETIKTLDQNSLELDETHLVISDGINPIAIAGVMGGLESAVDEKTTTVFIESAYFDPVTVRKSSKSLRLSTEASKRFERGADPEATTNAFWRIVALIEKYADGEFQGEYLDLISNEFTRPVIRLRLSEVTQIIGLEVKPKKIVDILKGVGCEVSSLDDSELECIPASYRPDISREIDLIEEIARIYGYDNIPADNSLYGDMVVEDSDPQSYLQKFRETMSSLGFFQHYSNSLQNKMTANIIGDNSIAMLNPLNKDMAYLRTSLIPNLIKAAHLNIKNSIKSIRLYELANIHTQSGQKLNQMSEEIRLAGIVFGIEQKSSVHSDEVLFDIFSLKGILASLLGEKVYKNLDIIDSEDTFYEFGFTISYKDDLIGSFGKLSKNIFKTLKVDKVDMFAFDICIEKLNFSKSVMKFEPINALPKMARRINLVMDQPDSIKPVLNLIKDKAGEDLIDYYPVEIFEDAESIGENKKSVVFEMVFQHKEKTLEDKDVNPIIDEIIDIAQKNFNAKLRV